MNISQAFPMSFFLAYILVAGSVEGAYSAPEEDGSKIHLRRTALKGQAALSSVEDGTNGAIRKGTGSVRQRKLTKLQSKTPAPTPPPLKQTSGTELRFVSEPHSSGLPTDWENTVEEMAYALKEAKKNMYKDECGAACRKCWNALGGRIGGIDEVVYNLQRMTHLENGAWKRVSFCSADNFSVVDIGNCMSAFDFMLYNPSGLLKEGQKGKVFISQPSLCMAKEAKPNAYILDCNKQANGDTDKMANSLKTCKDDTITLNLDFRAECAAAFDFLGGEMKSVKSSLNAAKDLFNESYQGTQCDYGVMFCPNGKSKNLVQIRSVLQAFEYLSMTKLNEAHADGDVDDYPGMSYWQDYGRTSLNGPRTMGCK